MFLENCYIPDSYFSEGKLVSHISYITVNKEMVISRPYQLHSSAGFPGTGNIYTRCVWTFRCEDGPTC